MSTDVAQPDPDDVLGNIAAIKAVTADWVSAANGALEEHRREVAAPRRAR